MANFKLKKYVFIVRLFDKKPNLTQTEIMDAMREAAYQDLFLFVHITLLTPPSHTSCDLIAHI